MLVGAGIVSAFFAVVACNALIGNEPWSLGREDAGDGTAVSDAAGDRESPADAAALDALAADAGAEAAVDAPVDAGFSPSSLPQCALWLGGELPVADGGIISRWRDRSGETDPNHDVHPLNAAQAPRLVDSDPSLGGRPVVSFVSADPNQSQGPALVSGPWTTKLLLPCTYYVVFQTAASTAYTGGYMIVLDGLGFTDRHDLIVNASAGIYVETTSTGFGSLSVAAPGEYRAKSNVVGAVLDGSRSQVFVNSLSAVPLTTIAGDGGTPAAGFTLGANLSGEANMQGKLAEVIVYRAAHGDAERAKVMGYLSAKYGIPLH